MKNQTNYLWEIKFKTEISTNWFDRAQFAYADPPDTLFPLVFTDQRLALDFLERLNVSFRQISESYLHDVEKDESLRPQVEELRKKFDSLDKWLAWVRSQLDLPGI